MDIREFSECCEKVSLDNPFTEEERQNFLKGIHPEGNVEDMTEEEKKALADKVADAAASALVDNFLK